MNVDTTYAEETRLPEVEQIGHHGVSAWMEVFEMLHWKIFFSSVGGNPHYGWKDCGAEPSVALLASARSMYMNLARRQRHAITLKR